MTALNPILQAIHEHLNNTEIHTFIGYTHALVTPTHYIQTTKTNPNIIKLWKKGNSQNKTEIPISDPELLTKITKHLKKQ